MDLYFTGIVIAVSCFLIIGLFHPIVIKTEYYTGTRYLVPVFIVRYVNIAVSILIKLWFIMVVQLEFLVML